MSIVEAERAARLRAGERLRARDQAKRLEAGASAMSQIVGDQVQAASVQIDENDVNVEAELVTVQDLKNQIAGADNRVATLRNELAAAKKSRTQMIMIMVVVAVVGLGVLFQMFK